MIRSLDLRVIDKPEKFHVSIGEYARNIGVDERVFLYLVRIGCHSRPDIVFGDPLTIGFDMEVAEWEYCCSETEYVGKSEAIRMLETVVPQGRLDLPQRLFHGKVRRLIDLVVDGRFVAPHCVYWNPEKGALVWNFLESEIDDFLRDEENLNMLRKEY